MIGGVLSVYSFHGVFARVVAVILAGLNSHSELIKMHDRGRRGGSRLML